ncbi:MAG: NAD(P)H-binding protein [Novosphingobium sp.]
MRILLLGASGFIGSELARALTASGHEVLGLGRDIAMSQRILPAISWVSHDLRALQAPDDWAPLLDDIEAVVNASGALQSGLRDNVEKVQWGAIRALIAACVAHRLGHFVQVSASNADANAASDFMASKGLADDYLAASGLSHTILRPGLVIGRNAFGGTEMLRISASFPGILPKVSGAGPVHCVAMSDLVAGVIKAIEASASTQGSFDLVARQAHSLGDVIHLHRDWLGFGPARWTVPVPAWLLASVAICGDALGWLGWRSPLRSNSIAALIHGVSGKADETLELLGREPLSLRETLSALPAAGKADRWHARTAMVFPLALVCLFALWFASGVLGIVRHASAEAVLVNSGISAVVSQKLVLACALVDLLLAVMLLLRRTARLALIGMVAISIGYLAGSLEVAPQLWLDPLTPMIKVLPALALALMCLGMVSER